MSRNSRRPPAVPSPAAGTGSALLPSKSELEEFNAPPLFGTVEIIRSKLTASWEVPYLRGALGLSIWSGFPPRMRARDHAVHIRLCEIGGAGRSRCFFGVAGAIKVLRFRDNRGNGGSDQQGGDQVGFHGVAADMRWFELRQPAIEKQVSAPGSMIESLNR